MQGSFEIHRGCIILVRPFLHSISLKKKKKKKGEVDNCLGNNPQVRVQPNQHSTWLSLAKGAALTGLCKKKCFCNLTSVKCNACPVSSLTAKCSCFFFFYFSLIIIPIPLLLYFSYYRSSNCALTSPVSSQSVMQLWRNELRNGAMLLHWSNTIQRSSSSGPLGIFTSKEFPTEGLEQIRLYLVNKYQRIANSVKHK